MFSLWTGRRCFPIGEDPQRTLGCPWERPRGCPAEPPSPRLAVRVSEIPCHRQVASRTSSSWMPGHRRRSWAATDPRVSSERRDR